MKFNFQIINNAALACGLLESLYPKARRCGQSLRVGNLAGDEGSSLWICLHTGVWKDHATGKSGSDVISLIAARESISQGAALKKMSQYVGQKSDFEAFNDSQPSKPAKIAKSTPDESKTLEYALKLWSQTQSAENTPVQAYLRGRGITCSIPSDIRYHLLLRHSRSGKEFPAMVAAIRHSLSNEIIGIHRTWILPDGSGKAPVKPNKMMLGGSKGGSVQLAPAEPKMAVAEGIETALSVFQETGIATWAALSTSGITGLILPDLPTASEIVIAGDNDVAGHKAALQAAELWTKKGRKAFTAFPPLHNDFNDLIQE